MEVGRTCDEDILSLNYGTVSATSDSITEREIYRQIITMDIIFQISFLLEQK